MRCAWSLSLFLGALSLAACAIPNDDLLPGIGQPCTVSEGLCSMEHSCRPDAPGSDSGVCAPVLSYGDCKAPTHPPGRFGTVEDGDINIDEVIDLPKMEEVRVVTGRLRIYSGGGELELGSLCPLAPLQRVGDSLLIGNTNITSLDGLQSLTSVSNGIGLFANSDLTSLSGLEQLVDLKGCTGGDQSVELFFANNVELSPSTIDAFVETLEQRFDREVDVVRCGNGRLPDRDPPCELSQVTLLQRLQDGDTLCE